jgi:hypothetical protein
LSGESLVAIDDDAKMRNEIAGSQGEVQVGVDDACCGQPRRNKIGRAIGPQSA